VSGRQLLIQALLAADHLFLVYFLALNASYLVLVVIGYRATRRSSRETLASDLRDMMRSSLVPPVSVIVTAYNEEAGIVESVVSLLRLHQPHYEVVVVNDGSTDGTLPRLIGRFGLRPVTRSFDPSVPCRRIRATYESARFPNLVVVDKENGGKGDALNAGINVSRYPLFCAIDGDSVLEEDALLRVVRPFYEHPDSLVAVGGTVRILNGCAVRAGRIVDVHLPHGLLPRLQVLEYLRAFLFGRMGWSAMNGLLLISGAFGVFRKQVVVEAGGYATDCVGEDLELLLRVHRMLRDRRRPYRVSFAPEPVCWTEAPEELGILGSQRNRWQRGLADSLRRHRRMIGRPRYGVVGLVALPFYLLFELLGPVVEALGYLLLLLSGWLGLLEVDFLLALLAAALLYTAVVSIAALLLDDLAFRRHAGTRELSMLASAALVEALGYRQLTVWWRLRGLWGYCQGDRSWGQMVRRGISSA